MQPMQYVSPALLAYQLLLLLGACLVTWRIVLLAAQIRAEEPKTEKAAEGVQPSNGQK